ncbi:MAG: Helicase associated domain protein [Acidimicrobiales bacterium]
MRHQNVLNEQATGRALRRPNSTKVGTVLLPVLLTGDPDPTDPLAGCDRRSLELVGGVLRALRSHDNELAGHLDRTRRHLGTRVAPAADLGPMLRRRAARGLLRSRVELRVPGGATGALAGAMALHLVREASPSWDEAYGRLLAYLGEHGATPNQAAKVADDTGTFSLGAWCTVQRTLHRRGLLATERAASLEAVEGWRWEPREGGWHRPCWLRPPRAPRGGRSRHRRRLGRAGRRGRCRIDLGQGARPGLLRKGLHRSGPSSWRARAPTAPRVEGARRP